MKRLQPELFDGKRILVRVPNWVGDAVMSLPALRSLRVALPDAELTLLARPLVRDVYPLSELRCALIDYDTQGTERGIGGRLRMTARLRREEFDCAILFQNAFDAALISFLSRIPVRAGYSRDGRGFLLTHAVEPLRQIGAAMRSAAAVRADVARQPVAARQGDTPTQSKPPPHEAHYYLEMLKRLGLIHEYPQVRQILLPGAMASQSEAREQLRRCIEDARSEDSQSPGGDSPLIAISPGASFGTAKRWPAERYGLLAYQLQKQVSATCVFFGSAQERLLVERVRAAAGGGISLAGRISLAEFMQLVRGCQLFITNDTGTMHLAAALDVPTLAIFGPTNEIETRPLSPHSELIVGEAECRPCKLRDCPIDHRCMTSVAVETVLGKAIEMLGSRPVDHLAVANTVAGNAEAS
jgi:heptosyltransferase-2